MPLTDDDVKAAVQAHAAGNVADAEGVAPQAAQGALRDAPLSGIPASVGMHAPEVGAQAATATRQRLLLSASAGLRGFVASDPANAAATAPDWLNLAHINSLAQTYFAGSANAGLFADIHQRAIAGAGPRPNATNPWEAIVGEYKAQGNFLGIAGDVVGLVQQQAIGPVGSGLQALGLRALTEAFGGENVGKVLNVFNTAALALLPEAARAGAIDLGAARVVGEGVPVGPEVRLTGPEGSVPPPPAPVPPPEAAFTIEPSPFEAPPTPGIDPLADQTHAAVAEVQADRVASLQEALAESETHAASPALVEDFLSHTDVEGQSAWVPAQAIADLWAQGHTPFPALAGDISDALAAGREVEVPLKTYLAGTAGQPFAGALNAATRFSEGGVSTDTAKELPKSGEEPIARTAPAPVEVPPDLKVHEEPIRALAAEADRAIDEVFKAHGIEGLFEDAAAAGLTKPQFERYGAHIDELRAALRQRLLERTYAQLRRERTPEWKAQLDAIVPFMEQALNAHPDVRAMRELMAKGMKLDRGDVEAFYPGAASRLPKGVLKANGNHPDAAADLLGYPSGAELVNALANLQDTLGGKSLNTWVKAEAMDAAASQARVNLGYDPSPAGLLASAREMLVESPMETYLTEDLRALAAEAGLPFSKPDVKAFAARQFNTLPTKDATNIRLFERGMRSTGETTQRALEKGRWDEAFRSRQQQLINLLQLQMAHGAGKTFRSNTALLRRWAGSDTIASTDPVVAAILQAETARLGFKLARDGGELGRFLALARAEGRPFDLPTLHASAESQGEIIDPAPGPADGSLPTMPWGDYSLFLNTLRALQKFGAELNSITSHGRQWAAVEFGNAVAQNADAIGRKFTPQQLHDIQAGTSGELADAYRKFSMVTQSLLVGQLRPEVYLHWVDGDAQGPLMGLVNQLQEGKYRETDLSSGWVEAMKASVPDHFWRQQRELLSSPPEMMARTVHGPVNVLQTRGNLRMALTYLGSESGREKLLGGYGWEGAGEQWLLDNATAEDWQFVQAFWAENEKLFALADRAYMARRGYGLARTELREVQTADGPIPGGYVHITYDPTLKERMRIGEVEGIRATYGTARPGGDVMDSHPAASLPSAFYTEQRTGYVGPVNLDPRALAAGVSEVIHDIAYRDALINAQRGLTQPLVRDALESVLGPEYEKQMLPWLRYIASERMLYDPSTNTLSRGIARLNHNAAFSMMAFQVSSSLKHGGVGLIHMAAEVKDPLAVAGAVRDTWGLGPKADMWRKFVVDNSGEVRGLRFNVDASLSGVLQQSALTGDAEAAYRRWGYALFTFSKYFEAQATWLAKYRVAMHDNGNHGRSVDIANKAVRDTQGAGHAVDQAPLLRNIDHPAAQLGRRVAGMFMGFRNTTTNRLFTAKRQLGRGLRQIAAGEGGAGAENISKAGVGTFAFVLMAALWVAYEDVFLRGSGPGGKKANPTSDFMHELGWEVVGQTAGSLIGPNVVFDAAKYTSGQMDQIKAAVGHLAKGEVDKIHGGWRLAAGVIGQATGWIPASAGNLAQAVADEFSGDLKPEDTGPVQFFQRGVLGRAPHYKPNKPSRSAR